VENEKWDRVASIIFCTFKKGSQSSLKFVLIQSKYIETNLEQKELFIVIKSIMKILTGIILTVKEKDKTVYNPKSNLQNSTF